MERGADLNAGLAPRRVVAGVGADGRTTALSDGVPSCIQNMQGVDIAELWRLDRPAARGTDGGDPPADNWELAAAGVGGLAWRIVRFKSASPELHATPTIDLVVVVDGEIDLVLEDAPVRLRPGDSAVIQQCLHGWQLVDDQPCTMVAAMITVATD
jgi:uncharacterized cupin superfamily protein